jgi:hypothetical protein
MGPEMINHITKYSIRAIALTLMISSVASAQQGAPINTLTAAEKAAGWRLLFDGKTLKDHWRQYTRIDTSATARPRVDTIPPGWDILDGHIVKSRTARDIVSREQFGDFELTFDWKLTVGGNAGVFYRTTEKYDRVYWSGPEYQLLDNIAAADNKTPTHLAGAVYEFYVPPSGHDKPSVFSLIDTVRGPDGKPQLFPPRGRGGRGGRGGGAGAAGATTTVAAATPDSTWRPRVAERQPTPADLAAFLKAGEWNVSKIVGKGNHIEHWLNGFKLTEYDIGSPEWDAKYKATKFTPYPDFARAPKGHFALQGDHAGILAFRNIKVREIK